MKLGVSQWSLHQNFGKHVNNPSPIDVTQFIGLAAEWGVDGLQIESIPEDEKSLAEIRAKTESLGLYIEVEAGGTKPEKLEKKLRAAKLLGAKVLRTFPALDRYKKDPPLAEQLKTAEENLKQVAGVAEKLGILVGVENHQMLVLDKAEKQDISGVQLAELLDRVNSPFIGVCLDTGNCLGYLEDPVETAKLLAPRTVTVHAKDYRIKRHFLGAEFDGCPLGAGAVDLPVILRILRDESPLGDNLCLNIESAVERVLVPFLDADWWNGYTPEDAERLPGYLRLIRDRGLPPETEMRIPAELGRGIDEIVAHERDFNVRSVAYMRKLLASMDAERKGR